MTPYYEADGITLYRGRWEEVIPNLPAGATDLVITSPPYNLGDTSGGGMPGRARLGHYKAGGGTAMRGAGKWSGGSLANGYEGHDDAMPHQEYVSWQHAFLRECWRVLGPAGAVYYNHKPRVLAGRLVAPLDYVPTDLRDFVRQEIIWARAGGINFSPAFYLPTHERIVVIAKPAFRLKSKGASGVGDVWYIPQEADKDHPAPFPLAIPARAIETTAPRTVLDPHAGRGTTLWAAKEAGVAAIGIELNEWHCERAARRLDSTPAGFFGTGAPPPMPPDAQESLFADLDDAA